MTVRHASAIALVRFLVLAAGRWSNALAQTAAQPLVGTWNLVSLEQGESAQSLSRIQHPIGILIQDASGNAIEKGSALTLIFPPSDLKGQQVQNTLHLTRLGGLADMWPGYRRAQ
jgi:hypothetical protein